jgi:hypothetical protein
MASLSKFGSSVRSSNLPSCFSTFTSSSQLGDAHGLHVLCDPTNALTFGASNFVELGTLGATSFIELQGTLCVVSCVQLQSTLGPTNYASLCSF